MARLVRVLIANEHKLAQISIFRSYLLPETVLSVEHVACMHTIFVSHPLIQLMSMGSHVGKTHSFHVTGFSAPVN